MKIHNQFTGGNIRVVSVEGDTVFLEMPGLVLRVFRGSYAEKYAEENGVPFEYAD